ncbi:4'-phosphopantetheinyl transferase family protein [Lysobacter sp. CA199]|uniref:4'-phosphopantetheinyl transferase family protein n=1 Tax=Lysobacter sp. CA199 TaxID=3455608 RepID=UPI003F8D1592
MKQEARIDRSTAELEPAVDERAVDKRAVDGQGIDEHGIDVWLAFYDQIDEASLSGFMELLNPDERRRQVRFQLQDDRKRYLVTRGMARTVLSRYANVLPEDWTFLADAFGRPHIADRHGDEASRLSFNISHTRGLIAMAVTSRRAIGVDVEHIAVRQVSMGIAERHFAAEEIDALARIPEHRRQDRFFEYWTFKEAYAKARGLGLSIPLEKFGFQFPGGPVVRLVADPALDDNVNRWRFWQCRPTHDHLLALCADVGEDAAPRVTIRRLTTSSAHAVLDLEFLKTS